MKNSIARVSSALAGAALSLSACGHGSLKSDSALKFDAASILDQVNGAIQESRRMSGPGAPEVVSVELDLQVGTSASADGSLITTLIVPQASASEDRTHKISLTFAPKPFEPAAVPAPTPHSTALTTALVDIYRSIAKADANYDFQKGSVQLQCTFAASAGIGFGGGGAGSAGGSGGSSGAASGGVSGGVSGGKAAAATASAPVAAAASTAASLVPISFGASLSRQSVQTITLNFGPGPSTSKASASAVPDASPSAGTAAPSAPPSTPFPPNGIQ